MELKPGCTGRNVVCRNRLSSNHSLTDGYTGERGRHVTGLRRLAEPSATGRGTARRWREEVVPGPCMHKLDTTRSTSVPDRISTLPVVCTAVDSELSTGNIHNAATQVEELLVRERLSEEIR